MKIVSDELAADPEVVEEDDVEAVEEDEAEETVADATDEDEPDAADDADVLLVALEPHPANATTSAPGIRAKSISRQ